VILLYCELDESVILSFAIMNIESSL